MPSGPEAGVHDDRAAASGGAGFPYAENEITQRFLARWAGKPPTRLQGSRMS